MKERLAIISGFFTTSTTTEIFRNHVPNILKLTIDWLIDYTFIIIGSAS